MVVDLLHANLRFHEWDVDVCQRDLFGASGASNSDEFDCNPERHHSGDKWRANTCSPLRASQGLHELQGLTGTP